VTRPSISAIVPIYNKVAFLRASLGSICAAARRHGNVELVFVDHQSTDGSWELLQEYASVARIHRLSGGTISGVRNFGVRHSSGALLSFIDCDCVVPPSHFVEIERVLSTRDFVGAGREYDIPAAPHWTERTWYRLHALERDNECEFINGGNLAVRREAFEAIGGFDESLGTGEDSDICKRLCVGGQRLLETHRLNVIHLGNPKSVRAFFRKQLWHGSGILYDGSMRFDKATVMILAHGAATIAALMIGAMGSIPPLVRIAIIAALLLAVPLATVTYRALETRRVPEPLSSMALYFVFYLARVAALVLALGTAVRRHARARIIATPRAGA